jgi:peptidoglycan DL-endopeptidase LytE
VRAVASIVAALFLAFAVVEPAVAASRYTVAPNDTLLSIARRFNVPLPLLAKANGIHNPARLRVGQVLVIPDVSPGPRPGRQTGRAGQKPEPAVRSVPYVVRRGDSLSRLAMTHGTTAQALQAMNGLRSPTIIAGQVIRMPAPWTPPAKPAVSRPVPPARPAAHNQPAPHAVPAVQPAAVAASREHAAPAPHPQPVISATPPPPPVAQPWVAPLPAAESAPRDPSGSLPPASHAAEPAPGPLDPAVPSPAAMPAVAPHAGTAARTALLSHLRATALTYLGVPYRYGGTTPAGLDCSGLVQLVYTPYGAILPRTSYDLWTAGVPVDRPGLEVGDLVFFNTDGTGASHVGIYIGGGEFVHPASGAGRVVIDRLEAPYYSARYIGARRVL